MALQIKDAVKEQLKARIALLAPTGGGKTYTALKFLAAMQKLGMGKKIGVIDTEHGSASKYVGVFPKFRVIELTDDFSPEVYIEALQLLADDGCDLALVDSLTHAWTGKGGSLELKDKFGRQKGFNDYTAWGPVTAMQNRMIEALLSYPGHLVATMRLKMEHVLEEDPVTKKKTVRKIGLQPQQRDGLEYEFDLVGDLDQDHNFSVSKTRCSALDGYAVNKPGEEVIRKMAEWLQSGTAAADRNYGKPAPVPPAAPASEVTPVAAAVTAPAASPTTAQAEAAAAPATALAATTPTTEPVSDAGKVYAKNFREAKAETEVDGFASALSAALKSGRVPETDKAALTAIYRTCKAAFKRAA
jgi:hypothetical protein